MTPDFENLRHIKTFTQLVNYLREELDWPIETDDFDTLTFEYAAEELGLESATAAKIKEIRQLRPLSSNQPWGIFFVSFEPKRLPVVALRRILSALVLKKRQSANKAQQAAWKLHDLLFISSYGESDHRDITFAHFAEEKDTGDLPTLRVLGWDDEDTELHIGHVDKVLKAKLRWPEDERNLEGWRDRWSSAFTLRHREVIKTSKALAERLAELAKSIRKRANTVLRIETEKGPLRKLYGAFKAALIHDLSEDDFADMYAQTISYGLLTARVSRPAGLVADNLSDMVPITNPFLKELLETFLTIGGRKGKIDFDELGVNDVVQLLRDADMESVLRDFGDRNPQEDPVIHFYQDFLEEYDKEKRMQRGVFYTPRPIVSFIVRSVDEILRKDFGLEDGLADTATWSEVLTKHKHVRPPNGVSLKEPFVQILDPAAGTGTFLVEVIDVIHRTMVSKWEQQGYKPIDVLRLWNEYVPQHLLPRLYGFELMTAPYAIAHMKIGLKLHETDYKFGSAERARIYLTNTLEPPKDFADTFEQMAPALAHEAQAVNTVKRSVPISVVVANPPYSNYSANLSPECRSTVDKYRYFRGAPIRERNQLQFERNIQDDFVKFIANGEEHVQGLGLGVLSMITNATMLASRSLRGMREHLFDTFSQVEELHLHGGTNEIFRDGQIDQNVFDIEQAVAIHVYARSPHSRREQIGYTEFIGARADKYNQLMDSTMGSVKLQRYSPDEENCVFGPTDDADPSKGDRLNEIFGQFGAGVKTNRDAVAIAFARNSLVEQIREFKRQLLSGNGSRECIRRILYRPFDERVIFYHADTVASRSLPTMRHMIAGKNIGFVSCTTWTTPDRFSVGVSRTMVEMKSGTHDRGTTLFPLYRYETVMGRREAAVCNLAPEFVQRWVKATATRFLDKGAGDLKETSGPEDIFHWIYACCYSPKYRAVYRGALASGFPIAFLPPDAAIARVLIQLGADLVALHLLDGSYALASWGRPNQRGRNPLDSTLVHFTGGSRQVCSGYPKYANGEVAINSQGRFTNISSDIWSFHMAGYPVCEKWLKDRKGRTLSTGDLEHYQKIIVALSETIRIMGEIDKVIDTHGGWPGAFISGEEASSQGASS